MQSDTTLLTRTLTEGELEVRSDGRTIYGLAVPFDRETKVNDGRGWYREVFRRGAFAKTIQENANRVKLFNNHGHRRGEPPIGRALALREDAAGLVGEFRVAATRAGDEAIELVREGALDSFSVGFNSVKHREITRGLVERTEVRLKEVSLTAFPAYEGAWVQGVRADLPALSEDAWERLIALARAIPGMVATDSTSTSSPEAAPSEPEPPNEHSWPSLSERRRRVAELRGVKQ